MAEESPVSNADSIPEELEGDDKEDYRGKMESLAALLPEGVPGKSPEDRLSHYIKTSKSKPGEKRTLPRTLPRSASREDVKKLQDNQDKLEAENKSLKKEKDRQDAQNRQMKQQLDAKSKRYNTELKILETKLNKVEKELFDKKADATKLTRERDKLSKEVESLKKERESKAGMVVKLEGRIQVLESQLQQSKPHTSLEPASTEVHTQRKSVSEMELKVKHLEDQEFATTEKQAREKLEAQRTQFFSEKRELESKIVNLERRLKDKEDELRLHDTREDSLKAELKANQQKLKELASSDSTKLKPRLAELEVQVDRYEKESKKAKQTLEQQERALKAALKKKDSQLLNIASELSAVRKERDQATTEREELARRFDKEKESCQKTVRMSKESVVEMEKKLSSAKDEICKLSVEIEGLKGALKMSEDKSRDALGEKDKSHGRLKDLERACEKLQLEKEELNGHVEEMVQKVSLAEAAKEKTLTDLKEKTHQCRRTESQLAKKLSELSSAEEKLRTTKLILAVEQKKVNNLHSDLLALKERREVNVVEQFQFEENQELIKRLQVRVENLQEQLHEEQLEKVKIQEHDKELKHQLQLLNEEKTELTSLVAHKEEKLKKLEIKVRTQKEKNTALKEQVRYCQETSRNLEEKASLSEQHAKAFQEMLLHREEEMEADLKKATLEKRRSLEKLNSSREKQSRKRQSLESDNVSLRESLHQLQLKLAQEEQWKVSVEGTCKALQQEKSQLRAKVASLEEELRDLKWKLLKKESMVEHAEKEKQLLEERNKLLLNIPKSENQHQVMSTSLDSGMSSLLFKEMMLN